MTVPEDDVSRADALCAPLYVSAGKARDAAIVLAGHARDAGELRGWLEALGLVAP
jgi:hypothetical protein